MIRLTKGQQQWGFASGRVSVLEGRLVPTEFFHALVAIEQTDDLLHRLQETQMREYLVPGATWEDWSAITDAYFRGHAVSLRENSPEKTISDLFLLGEDYVNLKRALLNLGSYPFPGASLDKEQLDAIAAGNLGLLPKEVREPLAAISGNLATDPGARVALDLILDGAYLRQMLNCAEQLDVPLISQWVGEMVLARAAVALWRGVRSGMSMRLFQQYFLPVGDFTPVLNDMISSGEPQNWGSILPGEIGDVWQQALQAEEDEQITQFGVLMYNRLTSIAQNGRLQTMGPERVFGYLWGLLVEVYNLKLIINGRLNGIDADLLKRRLREAYV